MNVAGVNVALSGRSYVICVNEQFIGLQHSVLQVCMYNGMARVRVSEGRIRGRQDE